MRTVAEHVSAFRALRSEKSFSAAVVQNIESLVDQTQAKTVLNVCARFTCWGSSRSAPVRGVEKTRWGAFRKFRWEAKLMLCRAEQTASKAERTCALYVCVLLSAGSDLLQTVQR